MRKPPKSRSRSSWWKRLGWLLLAVALLLNALAFVHAHAVTSFVPDGPPLQGMLDVPLPQQLGTLFTGVRLPRPYNHSTPTDHNLPYETRMISLANGEQLESWYVPQPQPRGIALMFVGYAGVKEGALTPAAKFYQWGYSSLLVDFRGTGGSSRSDQTLGIREAEDVAAAFNYARAEWPNLPIVLYGVSMGGAAVLRAAALTDIHPNGLVVEAVFDSLLNTTRHRFNALGVIGSPWSELLLFWGGVQLGVNPFTHNPTSYAPAIKVPVLLLYGEHDPWVLPAEREALTHAFAGPAEMVTFPGQGHGGPYVYGDPERWDTAVRGFLDGL